MEWVITTGKTVEEAKDHALDQLGVDEHDAEFEVLEEPKTGLFGRTRGEARVRARVRPTQPRPKVDRRDRRGRGDRRPKGRGGKDKQRNGGGAKGPAPKGDDEAAATEAEAEATPSTEPEAGASRDDQNQSSKSGGGRNRRRGGRNKKTDEDQEKIELSDTEIAAQGEIVKGFLLDLLDAFGLDGDVSAQPAEEGAIELHVTGSDLGLLIGPKGQTLQAIQELSRSVLQRHKPGETHARIRVDVAGYRQRRREALERFTRQVAEDVKASGVQKALEPMAPPDRKVVHDTVNEIDGVHTISEGEDSRRRVVIIPD